MLNFTTVVFVVDAALAIMLIASGPLAFAIIVAFVCGYVACGFLRERASADKQSLYERWRRLDSAARRDVEIIFRAYEKGLWTRKL